MKIVVLAAGEGVRMRPLTLTTPKPLLQFGGKTCLDHLFSALPAQIYEAIIAVRYLGDRIKAHCGAMFHGRKISYVDGTADGNAGGFLATKKFFSAGERFAVSYGDEIINRAEMNACLAEQYSWLCYPVADPRTVGIATVNTQSYITGVTEKPERPASNLAVNGFMVVDSRIFNYQPERHRNGEYYFSSIMGQFLKDYPVKAVMGAADHAQISTPEDLARLDVYFRSKM